MNEKTTYAAIGAIEIPKGHGATYYAMATKCGYCGCKGSKVAGKDPFLASFA